VGGIRVLRIAGFGLNSPDAVRLTEFYTAAFGAREVSSEHIGAAQGEFFSGVRGGALRRTIEIGDEPIDILQFDTPGRPYALPLSPYDTSFQHFALVVSDMDLALSQLQRTPGWTPISRRGPQRLPERSGGVTAFKFQDPDGHPLELLAFPRNAVPPYWKERSRYGIFLGIDHSAISVRDTAISTAFYRSLGFSVAAQTFNYGVEQANLDGVQSPEVEVTALSIAASTPHLELLCYRSEVHRSSRTLASNDVAATRVALTLKSLSNDADTSPRLVIDPDDHHLLLVT